MNKLQTYFKDYPNRMKCYETADGFLFHEPGDANLHATSLKHKMIVEHARPADGEGEKDSEQINSEGKTLSNKPASNSRSRKKAAANTIETKEAAPQATEVQTTGATPGHEVVKDEISNA